MTKKIRIKAKMPCPKISGPVTVAVADAAVGALVGPVTGAAADAAVGAFEPNIPKRTLSMKGRGPQPTKKIVVHNLQKQIDFGSWA